MDRTGQVSDDLLLRMLSFVSIQDIPAVGLVSKRWWSLSRLVSRLEYDDSNHHNDGADYRSFTQFVYRSLLLNKSPVLDKLNLNLGPKCHGVDIGIWIDHAVARRVRELRVEIGGGSGLVNLPRTLYTCKTLETLTLEHCIVSDVLCIRSLKTLFLLNVEFASLSKILPGCPNLEHLKVMVREEEHGKDITVALPSLRKLYMSDVRYGSKGGMYMIEAPCLEYLKIVDDLVYVSRRIENMPNLVEAHVEITSGVTHKFLRAISSARRLSLCFPLLSEVPSMIIFFYRLFHLELNTFAEGWWDLFTYMLQNSPKLASLKITDEHELNIPSEETPECWKQPSSISNCLETFWWSGYKGRRGDLEMATYVIQNATHLKRVTYVIQNATHLKRVTFTPQHNDDVKARHSMLRDLVSVCMPASLQLKVCSQEFVLFTSPSL